jgi:hypothetical protein
MSGGRPSSELLTSTGGQIFQTPEAEAIDQWFENLQNYEATLEEMAAASLDVNFKEELSAIEQWFRVLSEAERTAALYSLLQHSTQVQIRFFITVLQQMARSDPMTALLSPAVGASMQSQMEAKLASMGLKSPGLKGPPSPSTRNFANRQSLNADSFLSPDAAMPSPSSDAAATLAHQRAKLKANAAHRISAPGTLLSSADRAWSLSQLGQVAERAPSPNPSEGAPPSPGPQNAGLRPKSTDFAGVANSFKARDNEDMLSPMASGNWASMVNTPLVPMFDQQGNGPQPNLDGAVNKLNTWNKGPAAASSNGGRIDLAPASKFRRNSKASSTNPNAAGNAGGNEVYDNDGNLIQSTTAQPGSRGTNTNNAGARNANNNLGGGQPNWAMGGRSPALSGNGRFDGGMDNGMGNNGMGNNGMGNNNMGMGFGMNPMASPGMGFGMAGMGMPNLGMMGFNGMDPLQAQYLAAQMAAAGQFGHPGMAAAFGGLQTPNMRGGRGAGGRSPSAKASLSGREGPSNNANKEKDEEVDPSVLGDVPTWLRTLRLHKYTPNFEGMSWKDMVVMDEEALEKKGVAALGARRKMLKTFEAVRNKMGIEV